MSTFALDKNYSQFNFEEVSIDDLQIISGGSGLSGAGAVAACALIGRLGLSAGAYFGPYGAGIGAAAGCAVGVGIFMLA